MKGDERNRQEQALKGVKTDKAVPVIRCQDQEDDGRNKCDVGQHACDVVRQARSRHRRCHGRTSRNATGTSRAGGGTIRNLCSARAAECHGTSNELPLQDGVRVRGKVTKTTLQSNGIPKLILEFSCVALSEMS